MENFRESKKNNKKKALDGKWVSMHQMAVVRPFLNKKSKNSMIFSRNLVWETFSLLRKEAVKKRRGKSKTRKTDSFQKDKSKKKKKGISSVLSFPKPPECKALLQQLSLHHTVGMLHPLGWLLALRKGTNYSWTSSFQKETAMIVKWVWKLLTEVNQFFS